ncbi:hypothetical protein [Streptomyces sp. NPDC048636]|uniref:hypothetical protein n=1 Tax=Streptomyces sp. NPDC048636 TaxID=3155762 RepID=UPI0034446ED5
MSRESDSSSSGARGGSGGAAYPSGTPPYGSRQSPSLNRTPEAPQGASGDGEGRAAAKPEEPKTETTLTTRIRINIPGSRPIPPVVMRKPMGEDGVPAPRSGEDDGPDEHTGAIPRPEAAAAPEAAPAETGADGADGRGAKGDAERTSDWFAPRKPRSNSSTGNHPRPPVPPSPETTQGFPMPSGPETTQGFPAPSGPETTQGFPMPSGPETTQGFPAPQVGADPTADLPYFTDAPAGGGFPGDPTPHGATGGPATGDMLMPPGLGGGPHDDELPPPPGGPVPGPFDGDQRTPHGGVGPLGHGGPDSDRPLFRDPDPTPGGGVPPEQISSDTLVSGIPRVPPAGNRPPAPPAGGGPAAPAGDSAPPSNTAPSAPAAGKPKKKGRSKLVMVGALLVVVAGGAYSAGLVMNHADVPNGTMVLGVDIGGTSKEVAVDKLDTALGKRTTAPLKVSVDGEQKEIKPSVAGLAMDTETTVRNVSGRDYNPITVIGSLFGGTHEAEPEVTVDEEKLRDALERLAGTSGTAREGTITFTSGRAVPVYGKAGKALDIDQAVNAVSAAYRERAATGTDKVIKLPVSVKEPTVSKAEVDNKLKTFAKPAMSGLVTVQTDPQHSLQFSPERSLPKILSMRVVNGKLVQHYDLAVLKQLYGSTFDGVQIERGNGSKKPVSPQDVVVALSKALAGKTAAERVGVIDTSPN